MVYEKLSIYAKDLIHEILIGQSDVSHGIDAVLSKSFGSSRAHSPEIRNRLMIPEFEPVAHLVQLSDEARRMLSGYVKSHLGQVEIGPYACRSPYSHQFGNFVHEEYRHLPGSLIVELKVVSHVHKALIYGIDINVVL